MKLTDEMRSEIAAIWINVAYAARPARAMQDAAVHTFLAGYRMGLRDMRERAATVCIAAIDCNPDNASYGWGCGESAAAIRSLPIEDANG